MPQSKALRTHASPLSAVTSAGFTLIELMVVIGIIVLIIAVAMPAFKFMSGDRSVEAATNIVGSALAQARADAIGLQQPRGIVIYRDIASQRLSLAEVEFKASSKWTATVNYQIGDYVFYTNNNYYVCLLPNTAVAGTNDPATDSATWHLVGPTSNVPLTNAFNSAMVLDVVGSQDRLLLSSGVDARGAGNSVSSSGVAYRYFTPVVVLFDSNGQLSTQPFLILGSNGTSGASAIFSATDATVIAPPLNTSGGTIGMPTSYYGDAPATASAPAQTAMTSQIGVVLFDEETFKNQNLSAGPNQDTWIDGNGTPLMINRYNGTLLRGE